MLTLTGTLRQSAPLTLTNKDTGKSKPMLKLWVEHESPRENGPADLQILELLLPSDPPPVIPPAGEKIALEVRAYASGRNVAFSAVAVASGTPPPEPPQKPILGQSGAK